MGETILSGILMGSCGVLMLGIGISQVRSKKPVSFYSGEKGPKETELTDVKGWNRDHGILWILYGLCIILAWGSGLLMGNSVWLLIPYFCGLLLPIPFMVGRHQHLIKKYFRKA